MASFTPGGGVTTPFGRNEFLRSTNPKPRTESYTLSAASVPVEVIDGHNQKVVQPGTAMAKITSGAEAGKVGPFQADVTDGRQLVANLVGLDFTFLPYQTLDRDVEISVVTDGVAVQAWCFELDAAGARIALSNTTADALRGTKRLDINFA